MPNTRPLCTKVPLRPPACVSTPRQSVNMSQLPTHIQSTTVNSKPSCCAQHTNDVSAGVGNSTAPSAAANQTCCAATTDSFNCFPAALPTQLGTDGQVMSVKSGQRQHSTQCWQMNKRFLTHTCLQARPDTHIPPIPTYCMLPHHPQQQKASTPFVAARPQLLALLGS